MYRVPRIKRDPEDEPKYKFSFSEIAIFFILIAGFFALLFIRDNKDEIENNYSDIEKINQQGKQLNELIETINK